jgi:glucokinase
MTEPKTLVREQLAHNRWGLLATQGYLLGIDIGGYGLRAALIDLQQQTYASANHEPEGDDPEQTVERVVALARGLLREHGADESHLVRVGVGFGGPVNARNGTVVVHPRKSGWEGFPLQDRIEQAFDAVTMLDNDANLIALAEATFGVASKHQNLFYLHLSSGVGGGIVLNGNLYHGARTTAGEIGHALVVPQHDDWNGRRLGTLEQALSIKGLLGRAAELGLQTADLDHIFADGPIGEQVMAEAAELLGLRLSQVIALLDPELIVLGGIVIRKGGERLLQRIGERTRAYIAPPLNADVPIVASILGYDSVVIGGLALGLSSLAD